MTLISTLTIDFFEFLRISKATQRIEQKILNDKLDSVMLLYRLLCKMCGICAGPYPTNKVNESRG